MSPEQGAAEEVVTIRTSRRDWVWPFAPAGIWLALAASDLLSAPYSSFFLLHLNFLLHLTTGCAWIVLALAIRTFGVDLTPEYATSRGLRRRSVPWSQVQAVVQHRMLGTWCVRLILQSGRPLTLRAPTTYGGLGGPEYERDFHRIGQWWVAHRGESWRPLRPEAPQLSVRE